MARHRLMEAAAAAAIAILWSAPAAGDSLVVTNIPRQQFEGFGASQIFSGCSLLPADSIRDELHDKMFGELNLAFLRLEIDPSYQPTEGGAYDIAAALDATGQSAIIAAAKARNPDLRLMYTVVTPPAWMKNNRTREGRNGNNTLRADCYDDLALYVNNFVAEFRARQGFAIDSVSLQNEADFDAPYDSCVYTPAQWVDLAGDTRAVWGEFDNGATRLVGPELSGAEPRWWHFIQAHAPGVVDGGAWHSYTAGQEKLGTLAALAMPHYQTEFSFIEDIDRGEQHAARMAARFCTDTNEGAVAGWYWWQLVWPRHPFNDGEGLILGENTGWGDFGFERYTVTRKYTALRTMAAAITPGARQQLTRVDSKALAATAFRNTDGKRVLVVANTTAETQSATVRFDELAAQPISRIMLVRTDATFDGTATGTVFLNGQSIQWFNPWAVHVYVER